MKKLLIVIINFRCNHFGDPLKKHSNIETCPVLWYIVLTKYKQKHVPFSLS